MKKFRIKKEPFSRTGFFFTFLGFLLILLCLIGCQTPGSKSLYFVKVTDAPSYKGTPMSAYYGWRGYCIDDGQTNCYGHDVLVVPLGIHLYNHDHHLILPLIRCLHQQQSQHHLSPTIYRCHQPRYRFESWSSTQPST